MVVELDDAVALGVEHGVGEDGGPALVFYRFLEGLGEVVTVEDVIAEDEAAALAGEEVFADEECLGEAVGRGLHGVLEGDAPLGAVAEQLLEARGVLGGGDDEDLADAGQQKNRQRVVDHRLVVDGEQLLGDRLRDWVQPGAGTSGENDSLHCALSPAMMALRGDAGSSSRPS